MASIAAVLNASVLFDQTDADGDTWHGEVNVTNWHDGNGFNVQVLGLHNQFVTFSLTHEEFEAIQAAYRALDNAAFPEVED